MKLTGNEKAFLGGLLAFLSTSIIQLQQTAGYTLKDFGYSIGAWVIVHFGVWITTNSPVPVIPPVTATVTPPAEPLNGVEQLTPEVPTL